ncbi:anti-sigma factor [Cellulophaga omnivescoria]|uniref:anti-sigma factor n=1 Tax=Cellulophaga omnivescoria TaxID=1888890 RepID=UPI000986F2C3|nr:anti-sigma factor [Cellulophaga omnivescoria]WBU88712.1 anti-sigma factor [Cellulophaga omnivescoria]WKB80687.1 anti-sigma factor [Cellulophaga lytica]
MNIEEYIASGKLELYVAGLLSNEENLQIHKDAEQYPEIKKEIEAIEAAVRELSRSASPKLDNNMFTAIKRRLNLLDNPKVVQLPKQKTSWATYTGWAAAVVLSAGLLWMYNQNKDLESKIEVVSQEKVDLESKIDNANNSLLETQDLLNTIRDKNIAVVALGGQTVSPESYAKAYWNKKEQKVFIDAKGLPEPPDGFVYQVWSLKLNPLTPTSLGLLEDFKGDENKIFALANANNSEAFGITLEPAGGSESPTLEQLYTLGVAASS